MATLLREPEKLENRLKEIPAEPGVYFMRGNNDDILYIGKSKKLRSRVRSYFRDSQRLSDRIAMMVRQVREIEFIVTDTEAEALALEANLIKQHQPYYNVLLKDDKKYPYVCITWSEDYPRIYITRKRKLTKAKDRYYGPYVDTRLLRYTLHIIKRAFPLRQRRQPLFKNRPCLNYDMGKCPGVCQNLITPEEYHQTMQKVAMVFQGRTDELVKTLQTQMLKASEELDFEKAAQIRDRIQALYQLNADQKVSLPDDTISRDAIALAADEQHCCIQLFQIRAGKLVGRLGFFADAQSGTPGDILQKVLESHYQKADAVEIPTEIIVQHQLPEEEILTQWLTQQKGKKVTLVVPQRQIKAELIEMVEKNAKYELARTQRFSDRNNQALQDLAAILDLPEIPKRIEGYDISHIQGSNAVASQVVFIDGVAANQHYRHYKIKNPTVTIGHSDDFASMAEVIQRRFKKYVTCANNKNIVLPLKDHDFPDLVMIDGGKGQLSAVVKVLQEMNLLDIVKVVSLAKKREEIFLPGESKSLDTEAEQPGVQLLRRVRDEAHRFAVSFHRQQRLKNSRRSRLEEIPGLGFARQKQLLAHFHSIDYIREASPQQLTEVSGIGKSLAEEIHKFFHPQKS
ncbi:Excinuclease ABC subunit C [Xenococcus sp. PCC 7305]|uniref:excinuclease ABC subunit UvrC n=1 Tax=Xenococcus sp. PCC 7305 TaxID=102125 RepID=UPI0002ACAC44|nr:excinuclease ABC subunit UvrC [Xenococcus sp. PCC 7305]ELS03814.1 Excinuclease ABC subunit C [Xenococcus sp. PCC 7305]